MRVFLNTAREEVFAVTVCTNGFEKAGGGSP